MEHTVENDVNDAHKQKLLTLLWGQLHTSICEKYE